VLRALEPLARDPHGAVALVPRALLGFLDRYVIDDADPRGPARRAQLRSRIARLYAPAVARLGWTPSPADRPWRRRFRSELLGFLANQIEVPAVQAEAARRGRRMLGLDRDRARHADAVAPDLAEVALAAAVRTGGAEVFDALLDAMAHSDDAALRERALVALGKSREPALVGRALDLVLDPRLRKSERLFPLRGLLDDAATRAAAWSWLTAHFDALLPLLPDRFAGRIPGMLRLCDVQRIDEVRAFFAPRVDQLTGGPRLLAQALESGAQCAARVAAQRDSVLRALDAR
jgi:cytosol alanyl aminopeptidase